MKIKILMLVINKNNSQLLSTVLVISPYNNSASNPLFCVLLCDAGTGTLPTTFFLCQLLPFRLCQ